MKKKVLFNGKTLSHELGRHRIVRKIYTFDQIDSTNEYAKYLAQKGAEEGTLVISDRQVKGKGRLGRTWESPAGKGLWFSIVLRPGMAPHKAGLISLLVAVSVAQAIEELLGLRPALKWPNDVLLDSQKFCGILVESEIGANKELSFLVVGIGINVNQSADDFPDEIRTKAISLKLVWHSEIDRIEVLKSSLYKVGQNYLRFLNGQHAFVRAEWLKRCPAVGGKIVVKQNGNEYAGIFESIDESGQLLLRCPGGSLLKIHSGEVMLP